MAHISYQPLAHLSGGLIHLDLKISRIPLPNPSINVTKPHFLHHHQHPQQHNSFVLFFSTSLTASSNLFFFLLNLRTLPPLPYASPTTMPSSPAQDPISQDTPTSLCLPAPPIQPPSVNPRRLPPPCWSHDETVALIDAYRDKWYALRRGNLKATHWQEVADAVGRRCPAVSPQKTAVQCRHKMEKLRKRYRTEIQRARSMPLSRFSSSWVHFKRMDAMEKGPSVKPDYNSDSPDEDENDDEDDEDINQDVYQDRPNLKNGVANTRSVHNLYRNGISTGPSSGSSGGFRIRIPTGVSIAQPGPKIYAKIGANPNPNANHNSNFNPKANFGSGAGSVSGSGSGVNYGTRVLRGCEEATMGKREREPVAEMVAAINMMGDGFVRMEQMKMKMARELETMRTEMEMKRTEMILESQQRIVEAFAKAVSEKNKKPKRMPSPKS